MQIQGKSYRVTQWAKSTQSKVTTFLDDYLINYPVKSVRQSTRNLLTSLFKKGTSQQQQAMLNNIKQRIAKLSTMGNSSSQFLTLINSIFNEQQFSKSHPNFQANIQQKKQILNLILKKGQQILSNLESMQNYKFYSYLSNTIEFSVPLQPYLIEASGCLKCYGKTEFNFQEKNIKEVTRQVKAHISTIQLVFNRIYSVKDLRINLGKKKLSYKTVAVYYIDQKGDRRSLGGKYNVQQTLPPLEFSGSGLVFQFEFQKTKRHIQCHLCGNGNADQYCFICSVCFQKFVQIDGSFRVIGADPQKLSNQLCGKYDDFNNKKAELQEMYEDIKLGKKTQFPNFSLIKQMQNIYSQIMKNLQLFKKEEVNPKNKNSLHLQQSKDCFSCNIVEIQCIINFFKQIFQYSQQTSNQAICSTFSNDQLKGILKSFLQIDVKNKLTKIQKKINSIIANLMLFQNNFETINYNQLNLPSHLTVEIIYEIIKTVKLTENKLKEGEVLKFDWNQLAKYLNQSKDIKNWISQDKVRIFAAYFIKPQMIEILNMNSEMVEKQTLNDLTRLDLKEFKKMSGFIDFKIQSLLGQTISTFKKIFLSLLPSEVLPSYNIDIIDPGYLKYIVTKAPVISDAYIEQNIVFSPEPIIKLNLFPTLPHLIPYLDLEESMKLISSLVKYKSLWNLNLKQVLKKFEQQLAQQTPEKRLTFSLQGYQNCRQNLYLQKIYQILTPQRMNFIIRMQVPEADMQKQQKSREGGPIQYIYLPVRQVRSQSLNGDTMRALQEWVMDQLRKMNQDLPFDLIVDKYIIDNLDLPIEVVYKKIAQKQVKKKIGNTQYDFMKVIYRMQGFFGDANESASSNPRDENLQACLNYSSYLLTKIPTIHKTGLDVIMSILGRLRKSQSKEIRQKIFKILQVISMNPSIIKKIIQWQYADLIINSTIKFFAIDQQQKQNSFNSEVLLQICSKIIKQANQQMVNLRKKSFTDGFGLRKQSDAMDLEGMNEEMQQTTQSQKTIKYLLQKVKQCQQKGRKDLAQKMITLLPFCSKDQISTSKYLFEYFDLKNIQLAELKSNRKLNWFLQFIQTLSQSYSSFKIFCRENNFTNQIISTILQYIESFKTLEQKKVVKNLDILELSLSILKGLIRGDQIIQKSLFDSNIVQQIYKISKLSESELAKKNIKVGKVLTISYEIIKYFKQGHIVHPEISDFIKGQETDKKLKNKEKKNAKLLAMKQKNLAITQKYEQELMINENQENGFICSSCREGYTKRNEVIGVYIYSSRQQTPAVQGWWKDNKKQPGLTSVSYFTPIHYECHMKALEADLKIQKSQWQGALIRNSDVKCNGWIGVKGPKTTDDEYDRVNKKYFDKNSKVVGYWVVLNDLNGLIQKFATEYNFSQQTKGSSSIHNCKLILVLIASTCHFMKKAGQELKLLDQGVKYIEEHMTKRGHLLDLFFCVSLFTNTYNSYQKKKEKYFKLIDHLQLNEFKEKKKFYVYLALLNEIFCLIHVTLKDEQKIYEYLDKFIPQHFATLVSSFEKIAEKYKNVFIKWENQSQIKQYFSIAN